MQFVYLKNLMSIQSNQLLVRAAKIGDAQAVRALLSEADPLWESSLALMRAAENGHVECVEILLPVSEPRVHCSRALLMAVARDQHNCVDVLFDHSEFHRVLKILRTDNIPINPTYYAFECRVFRMMLSQELGTVGCEKRRVL